MIAGKLLVTLAVSIQILWWFQSSTSQPAGLTIEDFETRVQKIADRDAMVAQFQTQKPSVPGMCRQKPVLFPGGGKTFIVPCTATAETNSKYRPTFDTVLASSKAPPPA